MKDESTITETEATMLAQLLDRLTPDQLVHVLAFVFSQLYYAPKSLTRLRG